MPVKNRGRRVCIDCSGRGWVAATVMSLSRAPASRTAATELRAGHAKHIAQYPWKRSITVDVYSTIHHPIHVEQEGHVPLHLGPGRKRSPTPTGREPDQEVHSWIFPKL